jgi:hypothetical protein
MSAKRASKEVDAYFAVLLGLEASERVDRLKAELFNPI